MTGMDLLLEERGDLLDGVRVGLVCHPASMNRLATHSSVLVRERIGDRLTCLLGPEHGFYGHGDPGEPVAHDAHPGWRIPIYSLYGEHAESALAEMAARVDTVVFDLQDLGVRCYTYVHTLRLILETAARKGLRVVVTDRAIPFGGCVDGPMRDSAFESVIAPVATPFIYGMTPGETARWLRAELALELDLDVVPVTGYRRHSPSRELWPVWTPPSPAIRSWECALCYPVTVFTEALPQLDCARATPMAFRVLRADWLDAPALSARMNAADVPGLLCAPYHDVVEDNRFGIQLRVVDPRRFMPARAAVTLLHALQEEHGIDRIWADEKTDAGLFDRLMGTERVRRMLLDGETPQRIVADWEGERAAFLQQRRQAMLYP